MSHLLDLVSTYPTVIYTVLLGVALFYWLLSIVSARSGHHHGGPGLGGGHGHGGFGHRGGGFGHHHGGASHALANHGGRGSFDAQHAHAAGHADSKELGGVASALVALGLNGVPFSIVFSLLVLFAWLFTGLVAEYLLPWVPTDTLRMLVGTATLLAALILAVPLTAALVRPLRGLFVTHQARSNFSLLGQPCRILTLQVTADFGEAEVATRGAGIQVHVRAEVPNNFTKGMSARLLDYDETSHRYLIGPDEFT